ncbi:tetratricopeptide repeat protein [Abyssalbus ytuae]|uniref:Tetratricopeptide repeat protein n=1 Tax=Abyssalbus ytuae TaxID=2926907 RepID=A0A9E6ZP75_9FLAO|nr:tetratricopeptide repeat protein [Abyssalbus ytuae]UOB17975.1 tetratricopeptide repeat protein [Abyssalbus ytuae]
MKRKIFVASALLFSAVVFSQKDELKAIDKAVKQGNLTEARTTLQSLEGSIDGAEAKYKAQYYFLKGQTYYEMAKKGIDVNTSFETAATALQDLIDFEENGKKKYTSDALEIKTDLLSKLVDSAIEDNKNGDNASAAKKLYLAYQLDKNNQDYLYFASAYAVNNQDYKTALDYYIQLKELGYTGVRMQYLATNKETGEEEDLGNKTNRDLMVKSGQYIKPEDKETESRYPEIVKNIALIYSQMGETDKAIAAVKEARAQDPKDINLILAEANLYIKLEDNEKFKALMEEAIAQEPTNPVLYYNLGVISAEMGNADEAINYYKKAIELDPTQENFYMNLAAAILLEEKTIIDEMNSLGNSRADNIRYDELKEKREGVYKEAAPHLEKLLEINPNNIDALKTLMNIYGTLGETAKYKEYKEKVAAVEQQ